MGAKSRRKGAQGEREVCAVDAEFGFVSKRTAPMQAGHGSKDWDDTMSKEYPLSLLKREVKRYKKTPVNRFVSEYVVPEVPGFIPCLVWRDDQMPWMATMNYWELVKILATLRDTKKSLDHLIVKAGEAA
jgi:hypothetical protein